MFTAPSITLACVWPIVEPSRSLVFVVVPTDGGNQFALEGPDPANQNAWTRKPLTREQIKSANAFLVTRNPKANADLFALSLYAETWRFVWAVARHDSEEGSADRTHHATLASARRRNGPASSDPGRQVHQNRQHWQAREAVHRHGAADPGKLLPVPDLRTHRLDRRVPHAVS